MKIVIIAAIAPGGVIGRSYKPCLVCMRSGIVAGPGEYATERCAACENGTVPCNELPWPPGTYREDMEHFKAVTTGHAVAMGRNTKESIPSKFFPLEGRGNFIVSKTLPDVPIVGAEGHRAYVMLSLPEVVYATSAYREKLYVIGGARLYAEALPIADELDLTLVSKKWDGDVLFPWSDGSRHAASDLNPWSAYEFIETHGARFHATSREPCPTNPDLTFTRWVRRP